MVLKTRFRVRTWDVQNSVLLRHGDARSWGSQGNGGVAGARWPTGGEVSTAVASLGTRAGRRPRRGRAGGGDLPSVEVEPGGKNTTTGSFLPRPQMASIY